MAPTALDTQAPAATDIETLKARLAHGFAFSDGQVPAGVAHKKVQRDGPERKPVADDYMYAFKYNAELPVLSKDVLPIEDAEAGPLADEFLAGLEAAFKDPEAFAGLFIDQGGYYLDYGHPLTAGVWRDKVVFTWEYRTFNFPAAILKAASDLLPRTPVRNITLLAPTPKVERPYADLAYVPVHFSFETDKVGASAVAHLVLTPAGVKVWTLHTVIESIHGFPELPNRDGHMTTSELSWHQSRVEDTNFVDQQPDVVIIGGGHNGLMMAARCKALGIPALIIERNKKIGDNWRDRYEALSLHFPHWEDHFPYMPYPEHWPTYTPAAKLGDFLEWFYSAMELYAWTSSSVTSAHQDEDGSWTLHVNRGGEGARTLTPKHVVMATSLAGVPYAPHIPGQEGFTGTLRHSTEHDSSRAWVGKKVLVVGTSSSGFDTAYDFARRGVDVTLLQRSPTYIMSLTHSVPRIIGTYEPKNGRRPDLDECDRAAYAMPVGPGEELGRRLAADLEHLDHDLLSAMEARGFQTWAGQRGTGTQTLGYTKNGGFYFDAGACERIINGDIKVEQGAIERFDGATTVLTGGRERDYDLVVLATGFSNTIDSVRATLGDEVADRVGPIWGMDEEGELNGAWRACGAKNLWIMVGTLQHGRYHSKRVALRIKAMLEGVAGEEYRA
jgi:cation diffusion facilitator CzcD-associated flavoprotein CzcO